MSLPTILLILAALSLGATIIAIIIAFRSDREARSAIFPIVREEEAVRAQRARVSVFIWAAVTALFLGGWLASLRLGIGLAPLEADAPTAEAAPTEESVVFVTEDITPTVEETATTAVILAEETPVAVEPTATPEEPTAVTEPVATEPPAVAEVPTDTPVPPTPEPPTATAVPPTATSAPPTATAPPTDTPVPPTATPSETPVPPTATGTATVTNTPTATATPTPLPRLPTSGPRTPAPQGARMGPIKFATDISPSNEPVNPDDTFTEGVEKVYAVFPYEGMQDGLEFKVIWYQNGEELWRDEDEWQWGDEASFYSFIDDPNEGLYKLELHVNDSVLATGLFEVR